MSLPNIYFFVVGKPHEYGPIEVHPRDLTILLSYHFTSNSLATIYTTSLHYNTNLPPDPSARAPPLESLWLKGHQAKVKGRPYHRVEFKEEKKAMLLLLKCFDIKKVKSSKDLIIIDWVLGGKPRKKNFFIKIILIVYCGWGWILKQFYNCLHQSKQNF